MVNKRREPKKGFRLYIEGTSDNTNGNLREGFYRLLAQACKGNMPRIVMGDDRNSTIDRFLTHRDDGSKPLLLIDSDAFDQSDDFRKKQIDKFKLPENTVFFMIQEMEAWFLSQPDILDDHFKYPVSGKIPKRDIREIDKPANELYNYTREAPTRYHKVRDGVTLLKKMNIEKLESFSDDLKKLIATLNS